MNGNERQGKLAEASDALLPKKNDAEMASPRTTSLVAKDDSEVLRVSAWMYLRTIFLLAWGAFRHPFRTTYIDMASGEAVHIRPGEETWE